MTRAAAWLVAVLLSCGSASAQVAEPPGYREDQYRGPVPETLAGATVVDTEEALRLWEAGDTVFIDVLPRAPKPSNLPAGTIWREKQRLSIPGALWLVNTGYGKIAPETDTYFRSGLAVATDGNADHPVLFFCLEECWMSWNAARRAVEYGYTHVFWYPDGTDGWAFDDHPLEPLEPWVQ
ncbi:MAG: PQQ-dependent catabolism-associated CXXCW motif protein [Rhodobacteraceae bacterium]|nr:PQQ-dependent catabolism-associated CXXCW motif protein [Paracoccaceae bacterium]